MNTVFYLTESKVSKDELNQFVSQHGGQWQNLERIQQGCISNDKEYVLLTTHQDSEEQGIKAEFNSRSKSLWKQIESEITKRWNPIVQTDLEE
jgi:hypothetical protein